MSEFMPRFTCPFCGKNPILRSSERREFNPVGNPFDPVVNYRERTVTYYAYACPNGHVSTDMYRSAQYAFEEWKGLVS